MMPMRVMLLMIFLHLVSGQVMLWEMKFKAFNIPGSTEAD